MADVFLSYKRDERAAVEQIASQLRALGLSIWFDASLTAGETFNAEIDREARAAKVILVCWSPAARQSEWVNAEAMIGFEHKKLAACYVAGPNGFSAPTPFNTTHTEDLRSWLAVPNEIDPGWKSVLRRIGRMCGRAEIERLGAQGLTPNTSSATTSDDALKAKAPLENSNLALFARNAHARRREAWPRLWSNYPKLTQTDPSAPNARMGKVLARARQTPKPNLKRLSQATSDQGGAASQPPQQNASLENAVTDDLVSQYKLGLHRMRVGRAEEGATLLRQAANRGLAVAQYRLAKLYERGEGVPADLVQARQWTERAATNGHRRAMHDLGVYYARVKAGRKTMWPPSVGSAKPPSWASLTVSTILASSIKRVVASAQAHPKLCFGS